LLDRGPRGTLDLSGVALVRGAVAHRVLLGGGGVAVVVVTDPAADDAGRADVGARSVVRDRAVVRCRDTGEEGGGERKGGDGGENAGGTDACHVVSSQSPAVPEVRQVRLF